MPPLPPFPRPARPPSQIGTYNPLAAKADGVKEVRLKMDRVKYWLSVGAQPSEAFARLLGHAGVLPPPPIHFTRQQHIPKKERRAAAAAARKFSTWTGASRPAPSGGLFQALLGPSSLSPAFMRVTV